MTTVFKGSIDRIIYYTTIIFSLLWMVSIVLDYLFYHPKYLLAFKNFQYYELITVLLVFGFSIGYLVIKVNAKKYKVHLLFNGMGIVVLLLLIAAIIIPFHFYKMPTTKGLTIFNILSYLGKILLTLISTYFVYLVCYVLGNTVLQKVFSLKFQYLEECLLSIALGILIICLILFTLGAVNLLHPVLIWCLFSVLILYQFKRTLNFVKSTLFNNLLKSESSISWIGFSSLFLILFFISLTSLQNVRPLPFGFDSLRLYLNLPKLLFENQGLIEGNSPYYWSLFNSLGHILFNSIQVVINLSVAGGILAAFTIYIISRKWLSRDYALVIVLLFYTLPMTNFLSNSDVKDDLAVLFIHLITFLLVVKYFEFLNFRPSKKGEQSKKEVRKKKEFLSPALTKGKFSNETQYIILIGILSGMALGIKLTSLFLIFSIVAILFFQKLGKYGFLLSVILLFAIILLANLDVASGLWAYHLGRESLRWIILAMGLVGLLFFFYKKSNKVIRLLRLCAIYGITILLVYLPWPLKNYTETKELTFQTFIQGKKSEVNIENK